MPAEREREREGDRDRGRERASEAGTRQLRSDSDSSAAANSRSVKRRDDDDGDPARHGSVRERAVGSRGLLVDVIRTSGAIRSGERSGRPCEAREGAAQARQEGNEGPIGFGEKDAAPRSEDRCILVPRTS